MAYNGNHSGEFRVNSISDIVFERKVRVRPNRYFKGIKRTSDLVFTLLMLPVVLPMIALLWALVRLDGGPGFFIQTRVGKDGKHFRCLKLRTMAVDAEERLRKMCESDPEIAREWHENQKLKVDPRITRVGHFLRKTSLDELPQFLNILRGDMSVVGPRPFMPDQQDLYTEAGGHAYFLMRPGVTGSWQVYGRSTTRFIDRVRFDESYYDKGSLAYDLRLMLATGAVMLKMTGR